MSGVRSKDVVQRANSKQKKKDNKLNPKARLDDKKREEVSREAKRRRQDHLANQSISGNYI